MEQKSIESDLTYITRFLFYKRKNRSKRKVKENFFTKIWINKLGKFSHILTLIIVLAFFGVNFLQYMVCFLFYALLFVISSIFYFDMFYISDKWNNIFNPNLSVLESSEIGNTMLIYKLG